jgi:hypothetical protein
LTSALVETSFFEVRHLVYPIAKPLTVFQLLISLVFVPASLRYLERLWGSIEMLKFLAVTIAIPNVISFALNWLEFIVTRNADIFLYEFKAVIHGPRALT